MNLLKEFSLEDKCSYLDNKQQTTHYKVINDCSLESCQDLVERGYRRFGKMYFRPICATCNECQSIKIDVLNYNFSKSARRILKKASHINTYIQRPTVSQEHLKVFDRYHLHMSEKKDWEYNKTTPEHYYHSFVLGHEDFGYEVLYYDDNRLIGVDLIDILEDGISSIYFYYDPEYAYLSLGKYSLYNQIKLAKQENKKWIYLGYYVEGCPSLSYKAEYKPYKTLQGRPNQYEEYKWI
ncbi:arginyltransferase [Sulfurimonas aquatica]|uniref:Aspartate/glutamate leucyltransferase n=1 Tax=Sulfurimonas aquatica TaxID=2672570 RepID=A0A975GBW3_9BACT|nr:arginyltransferase [Sulfurimonas aquatica]QSZ40882.1 arginyltransferase [Sulfurimonas aquatica]